MRTIIEPQPETQQAQCARANSTHACSLSAARLPTNCCTSTTWGGKTVPPATVTGGVRSTRSSSLRTGGECAVGTYSSVTINFNLFRSRLDRIWTGGLCTRHWLCVRVCAGMMSCNIDCVVAGRNQTKRVRNNVIANRLCTGGRGMEQELNKINIKCFTQNSFNTQFNRLDGPDTVGVVRDAVHVMKVSS